MTKLLIGRVIVTYFARFNKSGKTTLLPELLELREPPRVFCEGACKVEFRLCLKIARSSRAQNSFAVNLIRINVFVV